MIYLDNAATTRCKEQVLEAMLPYFMESYGNASAAYGLAYAGKKAIIRARKQIAETLMAEPEEIYFTSGGTESDNWALRMLCQNAGWQGHVITSQIEHHGILHTCKYLEERGIAVSYLPVNSKGQVDPLEVEKAIQGNTLCISIMYGNNEVGTLQDIKAIGKIAQAHGIPLHVDAVAAYGHVRIPVKELGIQLLSASGHKFHGPKGIGFLYVDKAISLSNILYGGDQEGRKRPGTENIPGIVGMGEAAELAYRELEEKQGRVKALRDYLEEKIISAIPDAYVNGDADNRLPHILHVSFPFVEGESLLIMLDMEGICASSGSACTIGSSEPSHVLVAMGLEESHARGSLRLTLSDENTLEEMDKTVAALKRIVERLRGLKQYRV